MHTIVKASTLLCLLTLPGCIGGNSQSLSAQVNRHEQQIQGLLSQVGQVEQVLPGQAEMWSQMQTMRTELNQMHGQLDNLNSQLGGGGSGEIAVMRDNIARLQSAVRQMSSQLGVSVGELDSPIQATTTTPVQSTYPPAVATETTGTVTTPPPAIPPAATTNQSSSDTATSTYENGIKAFDQRKYKEAIGIFKDFTANYPSHTLASNANFWEGESYYQMKDYGRAALAYQVVIDKYQGSSKYQSALLKQGMALQNAGKKEAAKQRLDDLVKRYPNSPEATRAKQFLKAGK